jgi:hypothetical protein
MQFQMRLRKDQALLSMMMCRSACFSHLLWALAAAQAAQVMFPTMEVEVVAERAV